MSRCHHDGVCCTLTFTGREKEQAKILLAKDRNRVKNARRQSGAAPQGGGTGAKLKSKGGSRRASKMPPTTTGSSGNVIEFIGESESASPTAENTGSGPGGASAQATSVPSGGDPPPRGSRAKSDAQAARKHGDPSASGGGAQTTGGAGKGSTAKQRALARRRTAS